MWGSELWCLGVGRYTPQELKYLPLNTAVYNVPRPLKTVFADPNQPSEEDTEEEKDEERTRENEDGKTAAERGSDGSSSGSVSEAATLANVYFGNIVSYRWLVGSVPCTIVPYYVNFIFNNQSKSRNLGMILCVTNPTVSATAPRSSSHFQNCDRNFYFVNIICSAFVYRSSDSVPFLFVTSRRRIALLAALAVRKTRARLRSRPTALSWKRPSKPPVVRLSSG